MTIQSLQPKVDVQATVDTFSTFIQSNAEFCAVAIDNKTKLISWYKEAKADEIKHVSQMYDTLIANAEIELADIKKHVALLGLRLPVTPTIIDGENHNGAG